MNYFVYSHLYFSYFCFRGYRDTSDQYRITDLIGDYRARCLFSKVWALREAAVLKVKLMLSEEFQASPGISACLAPVSCVVRVAVEDKIAQVFFSSIALLDDLVIASNRARISKDAFAPIISPVVINLMEKLADGGQRIRDAARKVLTHYLRLLLP